MSFYADHVFPVVLDIATRPLMPQRKEIIASAKGRVLEIGIGTGSNLPFYSEQATEIVGIEPDPAMLSKAQQAAAKIRIAATVKLAIDDAQNLQFPDDSFDTVIMCLVLCTIPDPLKALQEAYRVLKPNGQLIFLEHVRAPNTHIARLQNWATPAWKHLGCGCHLNRDTEQTLIAAGFNFLQITRYQHPKMMKLGASMIQGVAVKR